MKTSKDNNYPKYLIESILIWQNSTDISKE